ncbi:MAG: hypothetical protein AABW86_03775, partial [Candidatus Micrarchaeota archaeon]
MSSPVCIKVSNQCNFVALSSGKRATRRFPPRKCLVETPGSTAEQVKRKTLGSCKEAIISYVRANPNCHTADLVKIA